MLDKSARTIDQHHVDTLIFNQHCNIDQNRIDVNRQISQSKQNKDLEKGGNELGMLSTNTNRRRAHIRTAMEIIALWFWVTSGILFIVIGSKNEDILTIIGSTVWIMGCLLWMSTYLMK